MEFSGIKPTGNLSVAISGAIQHPKSVMTLTGKQSDVRQGQVPELPCPATMGKYGFILMCKIQRK